MTTDNEGARSPMKRPERRKRPRPGPNIWICCAIASLVSCLVYAGLGAYAELTDQDYTARLESELHQCGIDSLQLSVSDRLITARNAKLQRERDSSRRGIIALQKAYNQLHNRCGDDE